MNQRQPRDREPQGPRDRSRSRTPLDDSDDDCEDCAPPTKPAEPELVEMYPMQKDFAALLGFESRDNVTLIPKVDFDHSTIAGQIFFLHSIAGCMGKSSTLKRIRNACLNARYYDALSLTTAMKVNDILFMVHEQWGTDEDGKDKMVDCPFILIDLARAFSDDMTKEAKFMGTLETLLNDVFTSGKFKGGTLAWGKNLPVVVVCSNAVPIVCKSKVLKPENIKCFLSAHRLMGRMFTVKFVDGEYKLLQDAKADRLAQMKRDWELQMHEEYVEDIEAVKTLTLREEFEKHVWCKYEMDSTLPKSKWVSCKNLLAEMKYRVPTTSFVLSGTGDNNLGQCMLEWYEDDIKAGRLLTGDRVFPERVRKFAIKMFHAKAADKPTSAPSVSAEYDDDEDDDDKEEEEEATPQITLETLEPHGAQYVLSAFIQWLGGDPTLLKCLHCKVKNVDAMAYVHDECWPEAVKAFAKAKYPQTKPQAVQRVYTLIDSALRKAQYELAAAKAGL